MLALVMMLVGVSPEVPECVVYGEKKAAVAGALQLETSEGEKNKSFDGVAAAFWLADDRARTCSAHGKLKLLDKMLGSYELVLEPRNSDCLLLVELGAKRAALQDNSGACARTLCGGVLQLHGVKLTREKGKKPCRAVRR
jgi:hypothetical protein